MSEPILVALAGVFMTWLIIRLVGGIIFGRRMRDLDTAVPTAADAELKALILNAEKAERGGKAREALRAVVRRAPGAETARSRAAYYVAGGGIAVKQLKRPGLAVALYLRALREDPACAEALDRLQEILTAQKRHRRLERTFWEVLARLDDADVGSPAWLRCWSGLAALYSASPRTVKRADAIRKALSAFGADEEALNEGGESSLPRAVP